MRHRVPHSAPAHLAVGLGRLEAAGRHETLLVVTPQPPGPALLERVQDARRAGSTVLALDGGTPGERSELLGIAHDALVADPEELDLDTLQHLVSAAAGENPGAGPAGAAPGTARQSSGRHRLRLRDRLSRLADQLTAPPPPRW